MQTKHTPGPWKQVALDLDKNRIAIVAADSTDVATVIHASLADAALLAAAPDLLDALANLVSDMERILDRPIPADHEAKAAIARATGA